jgi:hypothetical protein
MHEPQLDILSIEERIMRRLIQSDVRQIQPVIRQDIDALRGLVEKFDAGFEASKDRANGTGPASGSEMSITASG